MPGFVLPPPNSDSPFAGLRGHHVAVRATSLEEAEDFYVGKLDFRVVAEWTYEDEKLAYPDLGDSLKYAGYHHFCLDVASVDEALAELRARGVKIVAEPWVLPAISRKLAFFADPFGNLIELSEVVS
jgi:glyoxylase I family protein